MTSTDPTSGGSERGLGLTTAVSLVAMAAFLSTNVVIGRAAVAAVEPWTLAFWRWFLAFVLLVPLTGRSLVGAWPLLREEWRRILALAFFGMVLCGGGVYISLRYTTATNATLIYTASPVFVVAIEAIWFRHRARPLQLAGIGLAITGIAIIVSHGRLDRLAALTLNAGDIGIAAAAVSWAVYSVLLRRSSFQRIPTLVSFAAITLSGSALLLPLSLAEVLSGSGLPESGEAWASMAALAVFPSVLAFSLFQYGVRVAGPSVTSSFLYLMPVFGVLFATLFLGESLFAYHAVGLVLVVGGVSLANLIKPKEA